MALIQSTNYQVSAPIAPSSFGDDDPNVKKGALSGVVKRVLEQKEALKDKALSNKLDRFNPIIIGGDVFTMATFAFAGIQTVCPKVAGLTGVVIATMVCGIIAGVINIGVGCICFKEAMQSFYNGDYKGGIRLLIDSFTITAIGVAMILIALAMKVTALAAVGAFFAAHPWVLPVLFMIISIPVIVEIVSRVKNIYTGSDLASQLDLKTAENIAFTQQNLSGAFDHLMHKLGLDLLAEKVKGDPKGTFSDLSDAMEKLQAAMGVEAGLAVFKLLLALREEEQQEAKEGLEKVKSEIGDWNRVQYIRSFQQFLYALAFVASMVVLSPALARSASTVITAIQQFGMTLANVIPAWMDSTKPFKRNPQIVVKKVDTPGDEQTPKIEEVKEEAVSGSLTTAKVAEYKALV